MCSQLLEFLPQKTCPVIGREAVRGAVTMDTAFCTFMNCGAGRNMVGDKGLLYLCGHIVQIIALYDERRRKQSICQEMLGWYSAKYTMEISSSASVNHRLGTQQWQQPDLSGCKHIPVEPMYSLACILLIMATVCISTEQPLIWLGKRVSSNSFHVFIENLTHFITYVVPLTGTLYCFESSLNGSLKHCDG